MLRHFFKKRGWSLPRTLSRKVTEPTKATEKSSNRKRRGRVGGRKELEIVFIYEIRKEKEEERRRRWDGELGHMGHLKGKDGKPYKRKQSLK